jgi:hypothetical protein
MYKVTVKEHIIASATEMRELDSLGEVTLWLPKNLRHRVFHILKHGSDSTYSGGWGPEHILWDGEGVAKIHCTQRRAQEIQHWISDQLFGDHNE